VKKRKSLSKLILVLTIVFFVAGALLFGIQAAEYVFDIGDFNEEIKPVELASSGVVSITIVENAEVGG
jgi:hypothetical protein